MFLPYTPLLSVKPQPYAITPFAHEKSVAPLFEGTMNSVEPSVFNMLLVVKNANTDLLAPRFLQPTIIRIRL